MSEQELIAEFDFYSRRNNMVFEEDTPSLKHFDMNLHNLRQEILAEQNRIIAAFPPYCGVDVAFLIENGVVKPDTTARDKWYAPMFELIKMSTNMIISHYNQFILPPEHQIKQI